MVFVGCSVIFAMNFLRRLRNISPENLPGPHRVYSEKEWSDFVKLREETIRNINLTLVHIKDILLTDEQAKKYVACQSDLLVSSEDADLESKSTALDDSIETELAVQCDKLYHLRWRLQGIETHLLGMTVKIAS